jgi:hypothetical protein
MSELGSSFDIPPLGGSPRADSLLDGSAVGDPRLDPSPLGHSPLAAGERELTVRSARKDGRQVVMLRTLERGTECVVECEVYPVSGLRVEPLRPGPYRFPNVAAANAFIDEAVQVLTYLGCDVA